MEKKYVLYVRKSQDRDDRQVASIEDQINEMTSHAKRKGYTIAKIFKEAKSAKKPGRPIFNEMIQYIKKNSIDGLICWKLNRVARNSLDAGMITEMLQSGAIEHITSSERDYLPADNVLMILIDFGIATQYSKDLSTDVKRGLRNKAKNGWMPISMLPIGYIHNPSNEASQQIIEDPVRYQIIKELWRMMLTNAYSVSEIKRYADKIGLTSRKGTSFAISSLHRMFSHPFYCGYFYWKNSDGNHQRIEGKHKPMISESEFNRMQVLLLEKSRKTRPRGHEFTYRGFIKCGGCTGSVSAQRKRQAICTNCKNKFSILHKEICKNCGMLLSQMNNPTIIDHTYYGCTRRKDKNCDQKYINEKRIDQSITDALARIEIDEQIYHWAKTKLEGVNPFGENTQAIIRSLKNKKSSLQKKLDRLLDMRISEEISKQDASSLHKKYSQALKQVTTDLINKEYETQTWKKELTKYLDFALNCKHRFENASILDKKVILELFCSNLKLLDKTLYFSTKKPLEAAFGDDFIRQAKLAR